MKGILKFENFAHNMPIVDPLYSKPNIYYRDAEMLAIAYETDYESCPSQKLICCKFVEIHQPLYSDRKQLSAVRVIEKTHSR